jgi:cytochrome bd-type quinol oxidase subunit 2
MMPYLLVIIPLGLYLLLFGYETLASFRRLKPSGKSSNAYLNATWEVTHTILIIGVTNFVWLFSSVAKPVGHAMYWGLMVAGFCFIVRAILYVYLFYIKDAGRQRVGALDWLFAVSHIGVLAGLAYAIIQAIKVLTSHHYTINTQFIPWMWPGLIVILVIGLLPMFHLYRTK